MRTLLLVVSTLLVVIGAVWILQGVGVLGGGAMSGDSKWAVIGAVALVIGIVLGIRGIRRGARSG
jgi:hypothetical protein